MKLLHGSWVANRFQNPTHPPRAGGCLPSGLAVNLVFCWAGGLSPLFLTIGQIAQQGAFVIIKFNCTCWALPIPYPHRGYLPTTELPAQHLSFLVEVSGNLVFHY